MRDEPLRAPYRQHPALLQAGLPAYVLNWFDHERPSHYWSDLDVSQSLLQITVPALHVSGWFDTYLKGSVDGFLALTAVAASELARSNQYLIAGPWVHIPWGDLIGDQDFGPSSAARHRRGSLAPSQPLAGRDPGEFSRRAKRSATSRWERICGTPPRRGTPNQ